MNPPKFSAILRLVMTVGPTRTKILISIFSLAMFYGSICSAACAAGFCPNLAHYSQSHDCNQPSQHHSTGSHHHDSKDPDCQQHAHPPDFAIKSAGLSQYRVNSATTIRSAALSTNQVAAFSVMRSSVATSDLAPPGFLKSARDQQSAVLRI